jgi:hypothetical protein
VKYIKNVYKMGISNAISGVLPLPDALKPLELLLAAVVVGLTQPYGIEKPEGLFCTNQIPRTCKLFA